MTFWDPKPVQTHPNMASLVRSAKSGSDWSDNELLAFNIRVVDANIPAFSNTNELPPPTASAIILDNMDKPDGPLMKGSSFILSVYEAGREPALS